MNKSSFTAYDVAKSVLHESQGRQYRFGLDKQRLVKELRAFADRVERDELAMQSVEILSIAKPDDFATSVLTIKYSDQEQGNESDQT